MDLQINRVTLSKEIAWASVQECHDLYVEMMRNRVTIEASCSFPTQKVDHEEGIMFEKFMKDMRRDLDGHNVGLYAFLKQETFFIDNSKAFVDRDDMMIKCNAAKGTITIFFEDHADYTRFVKQHAVMFKLSVV